MFRFETVHPETGEPLEVEARYVRPRRGALDEFGLPMEPDEPEMVLISRVTPRCGEVLESEGVMDGLKAQAWCFLRRGGEVL